MGPLGAPPLTGLPAPLLAAWRLASAVLLVVAATTTLASVGPKSPMHALVWVGGTLIAAGSLCLLQFPTVVSWKITGASFLVGAALLAFAIFGDWAPDAPAKKPVRIVLGQPTPVGQEPVAIAPTSDGLVSATSSGLTVVDPETAGVLPPRPIPLRGKKIARLAAEGSLVVLSLGRQ